jgi:hypothetical protein
MITKEQYLEAKKIVDEYKLQLKQARVPKPKPKKTGESFFESWDKVIKNIKL